MADSHLKSFVIGSSFPVFILFFLAVRRMDPKDRNYSYENYTLLAPLYLGLMNVIGGLLFRGENRYLYTGILSGILIGVIGTLLKSYNYTKSEWLKYYFYIVFKHIVIFALIIQSLTNYLQ